ncbi:hypothetical protein DICVIV_07704 [Dictyocaulus viviparus]|uniref:Uncharacterized protein n=1 Tax=Dictyocaulus viviparus TaxID=29172 RepID=A0A0D8XNY3_DICVI|nr:hypothetical protein DICVIV_07704 [Dictyocaulus viviparus]
MHTKLAEIDNVYIENDLESAFFVEQFVSGRVVRRKRAATLKIGTMTEPRLNTKLRRPGRNDEPHPYRIALRYGDCGYRDANDQ